MEIGKAEKDAPADNGDLQIQKKAILLGRKEFTVLEASHARAQAFWRIVLDEAGPVMRRVEELAGGLSFQDLGELSPVLSAAMLETPDVAYRALVAYDDTLAAHADWIEENATDRQIVIAFFQLVELSRPGQMVESMRRGGELMAWRGYCGDEEKQKKRKSRA